MIKTEIINFIRENEGTAVAELQKEFGIKYKEAKGVIDELIKSNELVYTEGVWYGYIEKAESEIAPRRATFKRRQAEEDEDANASLPSSLRSYFEARERELEQRLKKRSDENINEEIDEENDTELEEDEIEENMLRKRALKLCIERGAASVSMLQRVFRINYVRACNLVDWMEVEGYIAKQSGTCVRKVLITKEEYENLCLPEWLEDTDGLEEYDGEYEDTADDRENFFDGNVTCNLEPIDMEEQKPTAKTMQTIFNRIFDKEKTTISAGSIPHHSLWTDDEKFFQVLAERMSRLIQSDKKMGRQGAAKKAEAYLEAIRDTHDEKMIQVYERLVYEIKNMSTYLYGQLKAHLCVD